MVVIDQNRAHERILYEDFLKQITVKDTVSSAADVSFRVLNFQLRIPRYFKQLKKQLEQAGFVFDALSNKKVSYFCNTLQP